MQSLYGGFERTLPDREAVKRRSMVEELIEETVSQRGELLVIDIVPDEEAGKTKVRTPGIFQPENPIDPGFVFQGDGPEGEGCDLPRFAATVK